MQYLAEFLTIALVHFLAVVSPGPDFALITRNALVYSRRTGIYSALGLGFGILVHVIYSLVGIGLLISQSPLLFTVIKFLGAGYLIWIGYHSLKTPLHPTEKTDPHYQNKPQSRPEITRFKAVKMGFITNVTNPKATLFFLSLFTQVINPETPFFIQVLYGLEMSVATFLWFAFVATMFSHQLLRKRLTHARGYIDKVMGIILIALALRVVFS